jgi:hypothetical protein
MYLKKYQINVCNSLKQWRREKLACIFDSSELNEFSVSSILEHTAEDWKVYKTKSFE